MLLSPTPNNSLPRLVLTFLQGTILLPPTSGCCLAERKALNLSNLFLLVQVR